MVQASEFRLGEIVVQDLNQNNWYDAESDQVTDLKGKALAPAEKYQKLQAALKEMRQSSWRGILLNHAANFFRWIRRAAEQANLGDVPETQMALMEAEDAFKGLPGAWDKKRAEAILKQAMIKGVEAQFKAAEQNSLSPEADPLKARGHLDEATLLIRELKLGFQVDLKFDGSKAGVIVERAYQRAADRKLEEARATAAQGNILETQSLASFLEYYRVECQMMTGATIYVPTRELEDLQGQAIINGLPKLYDIAQGEATSGNAKVTRQLLKHIQETIEEGNREFHLNIRFDEQRGDEILESALVNGIEDNFKRADEAMREGYPEKADAWLMLARQYVEEYNREHRPHNGKSPLRFDEIRSRIILNYKPKR